MQIQINKFLVVLMAIVLLGIGCTPPETSQNTPNQNTPNQNTPNQNTPGNTAPLKPLVCNTVNQQSIDAEIKTLPPVLRDQFTAGTISATYDPAKSELVFKGYLASDGNDLRVFFNRFNQFRGRQCVKFVYFQGATDGTFFEWRPTSGFTPPPPGTCKTNVENTMDNCSFRSQMKERDNLGYTYNENDGVLTLIGYIADIPESNGQLNSFLGDLQKLTTDGCISKIVFKGKKPDQKLMSEALFGWTLCEAPLVECAGECVASCPISGNTNTIINTNTNK